MKRYIVIQAGVKAEEGIKAMDFLTEDEYFEILEYTSKRKPHLDDNDPNKFIAKMGG